MIGTTGLWVPAHQVTTRNLGAAYPFSAEPVWANAGLLGRP
jgi:hypothetical protein